MRKPYLELLFCLIFASHAFAEKVYLLHDADSPQASYAAGKLANALAELNHVVLEQRGGYERLVSLGLNSERLGPESFQIIPEGKVITVLAGDDRGLIYGAYSLIEQLRNGTSLAAIPPSEEKPNLEFRGIKYNLPWETYRPSSALDQHYETARDPKYWAAFLDMMVENRFNVISLWNMNPFTYMVKPKNFPEASPWTEEQQAEWEALYRQIFRMAKERGLDTYIVQWSIFTSEEFSKAHGIAERNFYPHYYVPGDTSELLRRYLRESVTQILNTYPDLDGIGISHGEGMAGMTPLERQKWMDDVMIAGMLDADRKVKLIHRVPFSSGTSSDPGVSKDVEQVTREAMENLQDRFDGPIWVEMKFNWSHAHSTPKLVKVHGGKLGDTYFEPLPENYKITWQARNEDFFCLRWGVPSFIREHIALNGKASYVGGYFIGSETYIPALDYFTVSNQTVDWDYAFERQWLFYKLWGRLLYDPETPDSVFQDAFTYRYGDKAKNLLNAYSLASSTQLRLASLYDSRWDFTLYSEGFLALQGEVTKYIGIDHLISHPTMDPAYVSISEYVETLQSGGSFSVDRITPLRLAADLERDNREALELVSKIDTSDNASLMYEVADVKAWAHLGLHLAAKLRGGVALQTYRETGEQAQQRAAIQHLESALGEWDRLIEVTRPIYRDMRLTHYNHNSFDANSDNLFHWALIRDEVAQDVDLARAAR
ncbi:hypothetical protein IEN85_04880 [Pelagicoccus sp. NFK12]|uniref:Beta-hexosaminidase bacterial type N-terminal domain-containing protein n=1 Tax=Pelagicoccus enzymogenes TaxID=2773457 RepID=A0A927IGW8_9BACT|nr:hypothetical protein [Pelagicoccus enzymogenes]MBD5778815.1 hypothetical protein [Pelagicoccus enzymogenes]